MDLPLRNPPFELLTSSLGVQLFNSTRNIISSQKLSIGSLRVLPNRLRNASLRGIRGDSLLSLKERRWLLLRFTLSSSITRGSMIQIEIPKKIQILNKLFLGQSQSVVLDRGFDGAFLSNQLSVS